MASDPIAIPSLDFIGGELSEQLDLIGIYTQPDRRTGRGKKLTPNAIKIWAEKSGIDCYQPLKMDAEAIAAFDKLRTDLVLVMAYGHILPKRLLKLPSLGFYNLHASLLPKLRGASPIETAIVIGEKQTGVTLMKVVPALDAGPIIDAEVCEITESLTAPELRQLLSERCVPLLKRTLPLIIRGEARSTPQLVEQATYCRLIDKEDGFLDFSLSTREVLDHIRGFQPWPGALFRIDDINYRIGKAKTTVNGIDGEKPIQPGRLFCDKKAIHIGTGNGCIEILEIQKPGGKMLPTSQFLNGHTFENPTQIQFPRRYPLVQSTYFKKPPRTEE